MPIVTLSLKKTTKAKNKTGMSYELVAEQRATVDKIKARRTSGWWIPLKVWVGGVASTGFEAEVEMGPADMRATVVLPEHVPPTAYFQGNYNFSSFILVNYTDPRQWEHITHEMAKESFPAIQRQQYTKQLTYLARLENHTGPSTTHLCGLVRAYEPVFATALATNPGRTTATLEIMQTLVLAWRQFAEEAPVAPMSRSGFCAFNSRLRAFMGQYIAHYDWTCFFFPKLAPNTAI